VTSAIPFPVLTARLIIRPMQLSDAAGLFEVYGDADLMQHLTTDVPKNLAEAEEWVRSKMDLFQAQGGLSLWTVLERETGRVMGDAGLQWEDYGSGPIVGLGGRGARAFWHRGLALEASEACLDVGFRHLDLEEIGAETGPGNVAAQRLLDRLGMRRRGANLDGWPVYVISRDDWEARRPRA
jgi:RimJ/RimL family protein N-acetyltransferase